MKGRIVAGRYELAMLIGQGGMGQVWLAHDRTLDRRVAVKLLRPDRAPGAEESDEIRRRFARECRVTAQVDHPGLVTVHDAASDGDDLYLVMQYVQGADLADHLAEHDPYPWPWAAAVAAQLCPVLAAVHAVPAVHRDLKPRNIMIRPDGTAVVLDLGVAAVLTDDTTRLTLTGSPIGSPVYMAPEQAMGGEVGPRTDLYSLGVILHELLSGTVPFTSPSPLGVLHQHVYEPPPPLRRLRPDVPEALEALVLRLLAKDPRDRPADAAAVHRALVPLLPAPDPTLPPCPPPGRRGPGDDAGAPMDPTRPLRLPYAPWHGGLPRQAPPPTAPAAVPHPVPAAVPHPAPSAPAAGNTGTAAAVEEAKRLLDAGRLTQAAGVLGNALSAAAQAHGWHAPVVQMLRKHYAATLLEDGQFHAALPQLRLLSEQRAAEAGPADPQALRFRVEAAQCLEHLGDQASALAEYQSLLPLLERHADGDPALLLEVGRRTAQLLMATGDHVAARAALHRLLLETERRYGPHHPLAAETRRALG
ncbi:tRNA A-37 threonylcarbamoyl transferase component Bud32 [Kitasatospora sp. GP30]|uniref:serine/threonine-protein kinase n=1 Tax=Kitasatospora sp. GP30 TaxID=3035084 RepID=UPI000C708B45|nr:serine/threonine-protein kinase [Kitasatospora sp. GP30]MDH6138546.1 tRNA A-37 threonylcarbamoyl transferase component Bud32 [Kitasatospora sp. GP30]